MIHRAKIAATVNGHMLDDNELTDVDVQLISDVVYALTWSWETHDFAIGRLHQIAARVEQEKKNAN